MTRKAIFIAAGALLAAGAVATVAAQGHRGWQSRHGEMLGMDMEHDGPGRGGRLRGWRGDLTQSEHDTQTRERFARLDRNSDGVIDAAEIEAAIAERMGGWHGRMGSGMGERMLRRFDENRDGKVTREEFTNSVRQRFVEMDLNNDGRIDDEDLPPLLRGRGVLGEGRGPGGGVGRGHGGPLMNMLRGADANKDGVITLDEAQSEAAKLFTQFDRNKDNVIDKTDVEALKKEMVDYRVKRFIHHFGADKDGKVTREQFDKMAKERFAMLDLDNDAKISRDEMPGRGRWGSHRQRGDDEHESSERRGRGGPMMAPGREGPGREGPGREGMGRN